jgi:hypothetical protein
MKRAMSVAVLTAILSSAAWAQSMSQAMQNAPTRESSLAEYAGAWIARFEGRVWFTVRLTHRDGQLTGMLQRARDVQFSSQGDVISMGGEQSTTSIEAAQLTGDGLLLTVNDSGAQGPDRYLMRLTSEATAEIGIVAMSVSPGMSRPKPWKLTKVVPNAVSPIR